MGAISVKVYPGDIAKQKAKCAAYSANYGLIAGSGSAGILSSESGVITPKDKRLWNEYFDLSNKLSESNPALEKVIYHINCEEKRPPTKLQLECFRILDKNGSNLIALGDARLTGSGDMHRNGGPKYIGHAVIMGYRWEIQPNPPKIEATKDSVAESSFRLFMLADNADCDKIAYAPMGVRKGGLSDEESAEATIGAIRRFEQESPRNIKGIDIILYSNELQKKRELYERLYSQV